MVKCQRSPLNPPKPLSLKIAKEAMMTFKMGTLVQSASQRKQGL